MTPAQARDEIFALLKAAWDANTPAVVGEIPKMLWQGVVGEPPDNDHAYARTTVIHATGTQASLGTTGGRLFNRSGLVIVQCFGPLVSGKGLTIAENLATIAKDAFEGMSSPGGAWFRDCRINEVGRSEGWFQVNAVAEFLYDEVK